MGSGEHSGGKIRLAGEGAESGVGGSLGRAKRLERGKAWGECAWDGGEEERRVGGKGAKRGRLGLEAWGG